MPAPFALDPKSYDFPDVNLALDDPNGLLAVGGDLSPSRLVAAYRNGIFPWFNEGEPICWWSPDPRAVLYPEKIKVSRSLQKSIRNKGYTLKFNTSFKKVIQLCAETRQDSTGTWITPEMMRSYIELHNRGYAHSVEIWDKEQLIGGLYGVALGAIFFGESMFSLKTDASKIALVGLCERLDSAGFALIDCQMPSQHLHSLGMELLPRQRFIEILHHCRDHPCQLQ